MRFRLSGLAPFRQPFFRRQWPADIATSWGFEIETLVLGWFILASTGSVLWLTADDSRMVSAQTFIVDGGRI